MTPDAWYPRSPAALGYPSPTPALCPPCRASPAPSTQLHPAQCGQATGDLGGQASILPHGAPCAHPGERISPLPPPLQGPKVQAGRAPPWFLDPVRPRNFLPAPCGPAPVSVRDRQGPLSPESSWAAADCEGSSLAGRGLRSNAHTCSPARVHKRMPTYTQTHIRPGVLRRIPRTPTCSTQREAGGAPDLLSWEMEIPLPKSQPPLLSH